MYSGTVHTPRNANDTKRAQMIRNRILASNVLFKKNEASDPVVQILTNIQDDAARMVTALGKIIKLRLYVPYFLVARNVFLIERQVEQDHECIHRRQGVFDRFGRCCKCTLDVHRL
jgi:hypothetical protein